MVTSRFRKPSSSTLRRFLSSQSLPSEGRLSIRESLRIFSHIEDSLHNHGNMTSFEDLGRQSMKSLFPQRVVAEMGFQGVSCGSTRNLFAAIFLAKSQLNDMDINNITNGSNLTQFLNNPNILWHGLRRFFCTYDASVHNDCRRITSQIGKSISQFRARSNLTSLQQRLLHQNEVQEFPLVMFCSMTWTFPRHFLSSNPLKSTLQAKSDTDDNINDIEDHVFTIIKHSNDHFQLVQGYIEKSSLENVEELHSAGMELRDWQKSASNFSCRRGFSESSMTKFISHLDQFVEDERFDSGNHKDMFGISPERHHEQYWPSLSFMELADEDIIGCGERELVEHMQTLSINQLVSCN